MCKWLSLCGLFSLDSSLLRLRLLFFCALYVRIRDPWPAVLARSLHSLFKILSYCYPPAHWHCALRTQISKCVFVVCVLFFPFLFFLFTPALSRTVLYGGADPNAPRINVRVVVTPCRTFNASRASKLPVLGGQEGLGVLICNAVPHI